MVVGGEKGYYTIKYATDLEDTEYEKTPPRETFHASKIKQVEDGGITPPDATRSPTEELDDYSSSHGNPPAVAVAVSEATYEDDPSEDDYTVAEDSREVVVPGGNSEEVIPDDGNTSAVEFILPFEKSLPDWKEFESMDAFIGQRPHFRPLMELQKNEIVCEGYAFGLVRAFCGMLQKAQHPEEVPIGQLEKYRISLSVMEKEGFDIKKPLSVILTELRTRLEEEITNRRKSLIAAKEKIKSDEATLCEILSKKENISKEIDSLFDHR